jgi:hypothetical protein
MWGQCIGAVRITVACSLEFLVKECFGATAVLRHEGWAAPAAENEDNLTSTVRNLAACLSTGHLSSGDGANGMISNNGCITAWGF